MLTESAHVDQLSQEAARRLIPPAPRSCSLPLLSQPHSTAPTALKRYEKRYSGDTFLGEESRTCIHPPTSKTSNVCLYLRNRGQIFRWVCTADFNVVDPYRMTHTDGSTEKPNQPVVHA